ncbi:unnamed protein product [Moneuplotes crassus]|uniref:Uncharacterized protein n=1 Tax=Euplotes crassus TaxID=5936 RepID=A0AAD1XNC2_EUPCR|nr:unnamed protein product [Moneuplotes crassus]
MEKYEEVNELEMVNFAAYPEFIQACSSHGATKHSISSELTDVFPGLSKIIFSILNGESEVEIMDKDYEEKDTVFATLLYLFSSRDVCNEILKHLGSFNYKSLQLCYSVLYKGFMTTNYLLPPGKLFYTSIQNAYFNKDLYVEGRTLWWPKLIRGSTNPGIALAFAGVNGVLVAVELDSGLPHYHIRNAKVVNKNIVHPSGVYLFPWFCFKICKVIEGDGITLIKVVQTPWPKVAEESITAVGEKMENYHKNVTQRLYKNCNLDVKDVYTSNMLKSSETLAKIYGSDTSEDLLELDHVTKIPLSGWEC